jgi:hypothetical protein
VQYRIHRFILQNRFWTVLYVCTYIPVEHVSSIEMGGIEIGPVVEQQVGGRGPGTWGPMSDHTE